MSDKRNVKTYRALVAAALVPILVGLSGCAKAADSGASSASGKEPAATLENVAGSPVKRVVLSPKAAERLDVQTGAVAEQVIVPTLMVGGIVVDPSAAAVESSMPTEPAPGGGHKGSAELWIRVPLSPVEWDKLAKDKPIRILPLATRASLARDLMAVPTGLPPQDNGRSGTLTLFFVVRTGGSGLVLGDRVRVEVQLEGGTDKQKVVPYSAVYYDAKGDAWVYVNTAPFAFVRERITVDRVSGDLALLSSGPEVGTTVATVGAALLYGAEVFGR